MARFPKAEAQILALARHMIKGLREAADDFPKPPVPADELQALLDEYLAAIASTAAAKGAFHAEHARKDRALARLVTAMKAVLRYAEIVVPNPAKLIRLGWGPRRPRTPLEPPGEVRDTRILAEGDTYLTLEWARPLDGGRVTAYQIQRKRNRGNWDDVATCTDTQHTVRGQPRGVELEFRVYALNKAGHGLPGTVVTAVL